MRSENDVRDKLARAMSRHLQRLVRKRLRRRPCNCQFNREHTFQRNGSTEQVRLCMLGIDKPDWDVDVCEKTEQARNCPAYLPLHSRESVEQDFNSYMGDDKYLQENYRDIYTLKWVLGDVDVKYTLWQRIALSWTAWRAPRLPAPKDDTHATPENK